MKLGDSFNYETPATIRVVNGVLNGTTCTIYPDENITAQYNLTGDRLEIIPYKDEQQLYIEDIDLYYSIDDGDFTKYTDSVNITDGNHNVKVKFLNIIEILNENININLTAYAVRNNGKVYIYTNAVGNNVQYSFTEENFEDYNGAIDNQEAKRIFVKIGNNNPIEIEIMEKNEIYDIQTGYALMPVISRENGQITCKVQGESYSQIKYSFDNRYWNTYPPENYSILNSYYSETKNILLTIDNYNAENIYINVKTFGNPYDPHNSYDNPEKYSESTYKYHIYEKNDVDSGKLNDIIGIYNTSDGSNIFGQDKSYSIYTYEKDDSTNHQYTIVDDDIDIQKFANEKVIGITRIADKILLLKDDGNVYLVSNDYNELERININSTENNIFFEQIAGKFALDSNNKIWELVYNNGSYSYEMGDFDIRGNIIKLSYLVYGTNTAPYVIYTTGNASIVYHGMGEYPIANNVIDISSDGENYYVLQTNNVKYNDMDISISSIVNNGEVPIKINKNGSILTNKGNLYNLTFTYIEDSNTSVGTYSERPVKTGVIKLGDYTCQMADGTIYYNTEVFKNKVYEKTDSDIIITKDESMLNENKVIINVEVPAGKYTIKQPNCQTITDNKFSYEVSENGEYVFEFINSNGKSQMRVVHVETIQSRKETKVPEVVAINGKIKLESDEKIEYSTDCINWTNYTQELDYSASIYARVVNDKYECSVLKIILNENGELLVENTESREIQEEILTNAIGIDKNKTKNIKSEQDVNEKNSSENNQNKSFFDYISEIADNIIYSFSSTDGKFAGCYFEDNVTDLTYKDMDNNVQGMDGKNYNVQNAANIEYSIITTEKRKLPQNESTEEQEKQKVENGEIISYSKDIFAVGSAGEIFHWIELYAKYAYIDSTGNLISNIDVINEAKEIINQKNENIKYTKIVGDGISYYILTEKGEVYFVTGGDNGTWQYLIDKLNLDVSLDALGYADRYNRIITKLNIRDIVNIYDSCTALTKDGKMISLIKDNEEDSSSVQEIQKQTDKYLVASHLGLKDGKLYNFENIKQGVEVTAGEIVQSENSEIGIYNQEEKEITLFKNDYNASHNTLRESEINIGVQETEKELPEFVDIAEYRNSYLAMFVYRYEGDVLPPYFDRNEIIDLDYNEPDKYALCYAVAKDGEIWAYIGGYIVDTGVNLDFFGPTSNYSLNNTKWTNKDINLDFTEKTTNTITIKKISKENDLISENNSAVIEKNGTYSIEITDAKGRSSKTTLKVENIDKVNPVVKASGEIVNGILNLIAYDVEDTSGDYAKSDINAIEITYDDPNGDANWTKVEISKDENGNTIAKISKLQENKKLYFRTIDNAGNISETASIDIPELPEEPENPETPEEPENPETPEIPVEESGRVIVKYQDMDGNTLKEDKILKGKVNENYKVEKVDINKYELVEVQGNEEGKYKKEDQVVIYKYQKIKGKVIVEYVDTDGNIIKEETVITGKIDDQYKVDRLEIDGYELIDVIGNEEGVYQIKEQRVMFIYKKKEQIVLPKTGQARIIYIILGIVMIISISTLSYFNVLKKNK